MGFEEPPINYPRDTGSSWYCELCVGDAGLLAAIDADENGEPCALCQRTDSVRFDEDLMAAVYDAICMFYDHEIPTGDGEFLVDPLDTAEVLYTEDVELGDEFLDVVAACFGDAVWCRRDPFVSTESERLHSAWDGFCDHVRHECRFVFLDQSANDEHDWISPGRLLPVIANSVRALELVRVLEIDQKIFRAQAHDPKCALSRTAARLGTAPPTIVTPSNRMSATGIALFYGAEDCITASTEARIATGHSTATVGFFEASRPLRILDLVDLPDLPSIFDVERRALRETALSFLRHFANEVSKPNTADSSERRELEYITTQIVTDYFRHIFVAPDGARLDGIRYKSAHPDCGICLVLFAPHTHCLDSTEELPKDGLPCLILRHALRGC